MNSEQLQNLKGYGLAKHIGEGGFGAVYIATQTSIGREVAIKIIKPAVANKPDFIRRFETEAQLIARLEHPHITPLHDYWRDATGAYLVMRYLKGGSLRNMLDDNGALELNTISILLDQLASALDFAHRQQVIHRDIKPDNILLDEEGNVYLADFGIAKDLAIDNAHTNPDAVVGSLDYISPEQARSEPVTARTDIYSLGVVLYELITGEHPFKEVSSIERLYKHINDPLPEIETLGDVSDMVLENLNLIIERATEKDPAHRYPDVLSLALAFREAVGIGDTQEELSIAEQLTMSEHEVLQLMAEGLSNREIADALFITVSGAKFHIGNAYKKLGVNNRVRAIVRSRELDLITTERIAEHISADGQTLQPSTLSLPEPENPYKGLLAFQYGDTRDFFGRDDLSDRLVQRLAENDQFKRFLAVVGPSGSGKSSLARAGIMPRLKQGELIPSKNWFIADMIPGARPLDALEIALIGQASNQPINLHEQLSRDKFGLVRAAELILPKDDSQLVIIIDQFEEVFTQVADENARQHFLDLIHATVTDKQSRVYIIVTLRADYYDRPLHYPEFGEMLRSRMDTILPLSAKGLERAISGPAERVGVAFELGLVAQIVSEMNYQAGALPLLQYALKELFDRRDGRLLTHAAYQEIGGAVGALANRADEIFLSFSENAQNLAQQLFLRLVTLGEGAEDTRRRTPLVELLSLTDEPDLMEEIIDTFANYRLLSLDTDEQTRQPTVEVAHEAILREWDRLRLWLNESRDDIRQERTVASAADDWESNNRDNSYLLRGSRLAQTEQWASITRLTLTPLEQDFIQKSVIKREVDTQAETERLEREEAQEKRSQNLLRALVAVFALATILSGGFGVFALNQSRITQDSLTASERIRLAAQAQNVLNTGASGDLPALLVLRSLALGYSPEADAALLQALDRGFPVHELIGHIDTVDAGFSPRGEYIMSHGFPASRDSSIRIWDTQTGEEVATYVRSSDGTNNFDLPNRKFRMNIFRGDEDGDRFSEGLFYDYIFINNETEEVSGLYHSRSRDGQYRLNLADERTVEVRNLATNDIVRTFEEAPVNMVAINWTQHQTYALSYYADNTLGLWDIESGQEIRRMVGPNEEIWGSVISNDGNHVISSGNDNMPFLWDVQTGELLRTFQGHTDFIATALFSPDSRFILTGSNDGTARLWDVASGQEVQRYVGHTGGLRAVDITADGNFVLTAGDDRVVRIWNTFNEIEPRTFAQPGLPHGNGTRLLSYSPENRAILRIASDGFVLAMNVDTKVQVSAPFFIGPNLSVSASPDGSRYLVGYVSGEIAYYDVQTRQSVSLIGHEAAITSVIFDRTAQYAISASEDNTIQIWDVNTAEEIRQFEGNTVGILTMALAPDGQTLATGSKNGDVLLWDIETGEQINTYIGANNEILALAFSPDGQHIVATGVDSIAHLWDVDSGRLVREFIGHTDQVLSLAFNADGSRLLTGSADQTARIWDVDTGDIVRFFPNHASGVEYVLFSEDGEFVFTSDVSETYMWRADINSIMEVACERLGQRPRDFSDAERSLYNINDNNPTCEDISGNDDAPVATWTPAPLPATPDPSITILPLTRPDCPDYINYEFEFLNDRAFTDMGVIMRDVFVPDGNGQVVRSLDTSEVGLTMPLYATTELVDRAGPPFEVGPFPIGDPIGITVGHWLSTSGTGTYTRCNDLATINIILEHLVPNGLYTLWCYGWNDIIEKEDPCGAPDGSDNIFIADELGRAEIVMELDNFLLEDSSLNYGVAAVYHSDGQTYGSEPGIWGQNVHFQAFIDFRPAEG